MYFEDNEDMKISLKALMRAVHNPNVRAQWDKDVEASGYLSKEDLEEEVSYHESKMLIFQQRIKSAISFISKRDFLEKKLKFKVAVAQTDEECSGKPKARHFVVFSSIPDKLSPPQNASSVRATVILGMHVFERLADGRLQFQSLL